MGRCSHALRENERAALDALPDYGQSGGTGQRATGTDDPSSGPETPILTWRFAWRERAEIREAAEFRGPGTPGASGV